MEIIVFLAGMVGSAVVTVVVLVSATWSIKQLALRLTRRWAKRYKERYERAGVRIEIQSFVIEQFAAYIAICFYMLVGMYFVLGAIYAVYKSRVDGLHPDMKLMWTFMLIPIGGFTTFFNIFAWQAFRIWRESTLRGNELLRLAKQFRNDSRPE